MGGVVVPVRYPLSDHSRRTLAEAVRIAEERGAPLSVLHVNLYQDDRKATRKELKRAVEAAVGPIDDARYVVRRGFIVEEAILEEIVGQDADVVVIGHKQSGAWRRMLGRLLDDPDVETYLRERVDCDVVTVQPG